MTTLTTVLQTLLHEPARPWYLHALVIETGASKAGVRFALDELHQRGWVTTFTEDDDPIVLGRHLRQYHQLIPAALPEARAWLADALNQPAGKGRNAAAQHIAKALATEIRDGTYTPGQRLPGTRTLMERFGVSVHVAIAALKLLKADGLIEVRRSSGARVRDDFKINS
jgi:hypothetical protein